MHCRIDSMYTLSHLTRCSQWPCCTYNLNKAKSAQGLNFSMSKPVCEGHWCIVQSQAHTGRIHEGRCGSALWGPQKSECKGLLNDLEERLGALQQGARLPRANSSNCCCRLSSPSCSQPVCDTLGWQWLGVAAVMSTAAASTSS